MARKNGVMVYFSDDELAKIKDLSNKKGLSLSSLLRYLVLEKVAEELER